MFIDIAERIQCSQEERRSLIPLITLISDLAYQARREGLLSLEDDIENISPFMLNVGVQLVVDGTDPETVDEILFSYLLSENKRGVAFLRDWIIREGVLSIQAGDNPRIVVDKLAGYLGEAIAHEVKESQGMHSPLFVHEKREELRHLLEMSLADWCAPPENDPPSIRISPEKWDERVITRVLREMSAHDCLHLLEELSKESRKSILRSISSFRMVLLKDILREWKEEAAKESGRNSDTGPGVLRWNEVIDTLVSHGEIVISEVGRNDGEKNI